ncbi:Ryncolin-3 [Exaiptasia diaphana]|nr:Ryncolin-3 [Exaiptasia diaphana]
MKTNGGGWVVIHKRFDASVSFNRVWKEYKKGFGVMKTGEFWLGNDFIHRLTAAKPTQVYIELEDTNGLRSYAKYSSFNVKSRTVWLLVLQIGIMTSTAREIVLLVVDGGSIGAPQRY